MAFVVTELVGKHEEAYEMGMMRERDQRNIINKIFKTKTRFC